MKNDNDNEPVPFTTDCPPPEDESNGTSKRSPKAKSPWLFHIGPIYIARKEASKIRLLVAPGFQRLSDRVFIRHYIEKGDIVQIREGHNDTVTGCFAEVEGVWLESVDIRFPCPANPKPVVIRRKKVHISHLIKIGKGKAHVKGTARRNVSKLLKGK